MRKLLMVFAGIFVLGSLVGVILGGSLVAEIKNIDLPNGAWVQVLLCFGIAGACGGLLASAQHADLLKLFQSPDEAHWKDERLRNSLLALFISACGGIGGSAAALFVMLINDKIHVPFNDLNRLSYITSGLLGGFIGFQLLKRVAEGFAKTMDAAKDAAKEKASEVVAQKLQEEAKRTELSDAVTEAMIALHVTKKPEAVKSATIRLQKAWEEFPDNRRAAIVLGRLYKSVEDYPKGIEVLSRALLEMQKGQPKGVDLAAVLFNRACYESLLFAKGGSADAALRSQCLADLSASISLDPGNRAEARDDQDFQPLHGDPDFKKLVGL